MLTHPAPPSIYYLQVCVLKANGSEGIGSLVPHTTCWDLFAERAYSSVSSGNENCVAELEGYWGGRADGDKRAVQMEEDWSCNICYSVLMDPVVGTHGDLPARIKLAFAAPLPPADTRCTPALCICSQGAAGTTSARGALLTGQHTKRKWGDILSAAQPAVRTCARWRT